MKYSGYWRQSSSHQWYKLAEGDNEMEVYYQLRNALKFNSSWRSTALTLPVTQYDSDGSIARVIDALANGEILVVSANRDPNVNGCSVVQQYQNNECSYSNSGEVS